MTELTAQQWKTIGETEQVFLREDYVTVKPGEPFRLFPFGRLVKGGEIRELTRELLSKFRLPHFQPAIKLGSHLDETPAGGHIVGLEVRDDGLYALPEFTEKGEKAIEDGDYKYQSPEVLWEGAFEDPDTGDSIEGPLIVGAALLHTPHMGHNAALYSVDPIDNGGVTMSEQVTTSNDVAWYQSYIDRLTGRNVQPIPSKPLEPTPAEIPGVEPEKFVALEKERDKFQARIAEMEAEKQQVGRVTYFAAEFKGTVLDESSELHELLADIRDEPTAEALLVQFKALSGQIVASNLTKDIGSAGEEDVEPIEAFNAAVLAKMEEAKVDYNAAMQMVLVESPDLAPERIGG